MKTQMYTITVFSENKPGLLYRIAGLFLKRKANIESLTVSETERQGISRFTIMISVDEATVRKIAAQLGRVIEVTRVEIHTDEKLIHREIALIRLSVNEESIISEIERKIQMYWGHVVHHSGKDIIVEVHGSEERINDCYRMLSTYGITEFIRSGRIAVTRSL